MTTITDIPARRYGRPCSDERELFRRLRRDGDERARGELVDRFMGLAKNVGHRYRHPSEPYDDLVQVAALGLLKAIDRYDPDRGVGFPSFALPTMLGEVRRHFRDRSWAVRPPRELQELALRIEKVTSRLSSELGRHPTVEDLAEHLEVSELAVHKALEAGEARSALSLSAPCPEAGEDIVLGDAIRDEELGFEHAERAATLARLLAALTPRERKVLALRYQGDLTQGEIGEIIGVSQTHVSRIVRQAVEKLRLAAE